MKLTHQAGDLIGPGQKKQYRILEKISSGGMGTVYKVLDTLTQNVHAVKECDVLDDPRRKQISREEAMALFLSEGARMERLRHAGIPRCFILRDAEVDLRLCLQCGNAIGADLATCGICNNAPTSLYYQGMHITERCYLFMEFIEGEDLGERFAHLPRPLAGDNLARLLERLAEVADVLDYLHQQNLVHRDIKPDNIRISRTDDRVYLLDYGLLAEVLPPGKTKTLATALGTVGYAPPDQAAGDITTALDSYALAVTLLALGSGLEPTNPMELGPLLSQSPQQLIPDLSPSLAQLLDRARAAQPAERPHAAAWRTALQTAAQPVTAPPPLPVTPPPSPQTMAPPVHTHAGDTVKPVQHAPVQRDRLKPAVLVQIAVLAVVVLLLAYTFAPGDQAQSFVAKARPGAVIYQNMNLQGERTQLKGGESLVVQHEADAWLRVLRINDAAGKGFIQSQMVRRQRSAQ